jgi:hypothetical protein
MLSLKLETGSRKQKRAPSRFEDCSDFVCNYYYRDLNIAHNISIRDCAKFLLIPTKHSSLWGAETVLVRLLGRRSPPAETVLVCLDERL